MNRMFGFATVGLLAFDLVCIIIAVSIDYWAAYSIGSISVYTGLWEVCGQVGPIKTCSKITDSKDHDAVRAMVILALLLVCVAIACVLLNMFVMQDKRVVLFVAIGALIFAGLFLMIGFAVYYADIFKSLQVKNPQMSLHAGFAFCIIAWLLSWAGAGVVAVIAFNTTRGVQ